MGAGNLARAKRIAWTGAAAGFAVTEIVGVIVAIVPTLWLHIFSHETGVVGTGSQYLHTVAPIYGAVGMQMLLYFAAQGGGARAVAVPGRHGAAGDRSGCRLARGDAMGLRPVGTVRRYRFVRGDLKPVRPGRDDHWRDLADGGGIEEIRLSADPRELA